MTVTYELDLDSVKLNQQVKHLGQRSTIIIWKNAYKHTVD